MTTDSVEQRLSKLEHELERTKAVNEIRNIMSTMQALHTSGRAEEIGKLFSKRSDNRVYFCREGYWESADAADRAGKRFIGGSKVGFMPMHLMVNPVIQVADDGQTAQAIWVAAGIVVMKNNQTGEPACMWEWNRYGDDYIKEDGEWKLWHHHIFDLFQCGWDDKWADQFKRSMPEMHLADDQKPDHPPTPLDVGYRTDAELPYIRIPEPYKTWDPKQIY